MEFLIENWYIGAAILVLLFICGVAVRLFFNLPYSRQTEKVRQWFLHAVSIVEHRIGSGYGKDKLRIVYNMFAIRYKWISLIVSFEQFEALVDSALADMREMLEKGKTPKEIADETDKYEPKN